MKKRKIGPGDHQQEAQGFEIPEFDFDMSDFNAGLEPVDPMEFGMSLGDLADFNASLGDLGELNLDIEPFDPFDIEPFDPLNIVLIDPGDLDGDTPGGRG